MIDLDEHFNRKHACEHVVGAGEKRSLLGVRRDVWPFHRQCDAVQCDEQQHDVVEPASCHYPGAESSHSDVEKSIDNHNEISIIWTKLRMLCKLSNTYIHINSAYFQKGWIETMDN